jgi:glutaredoxin 3
MKTIEIYSTPTCHFCHLAKELLTSLNAPFTDYNVNENEEKRKELIESGAMGVPMIVEQMMGFDEERLRELFQK